MSAEQTHPNATSHSQGQSAVLDQPEQTGLLPLWKVLLHNDDHNTIDHVVASLMQVVHFKEPAAIEHMLEAHRTGLSLLVVVHQEKAELLQEQLQSKSLTVTIEPDE